MTTAPTLEKRDEIWLRLTVALVFLLIFIFIAYMVITGKTGDFDDLIDGAIYSLRGTVSVAFFSRFTHIGDPVCIVCFLVVLLIIPRTRWQIGVPAAATSLIGCGFYAILKWAIARERPDESLHLIEQDGFSFPSGHSMNILICLGVLIFLVRCIAAVTERGVPSAPDTPGVSNTPGASSAPSTPDTAGVGGAAPVGKVHRLAKHPLQISRRTANILTVVLALLILVIGFSRIFVGVHYVTDVLGGWSIGMAWLMTATAIMKWKDIV